MTAVVSSNEQKGCCWLIGETARDTVFTPSKLSEEHRLIAQTADEFVTNEVLPMVDRLEEKDWTLVRKLLRRCGELGLVGTDVPERFGGVQLDMAASVVVAEYISRSASFGATFGAQTSLTIMPLLLFGTEEQKLRYLPGLTSGELVGAYCLSEAGSGSDALAARARATRQPDGSFVLNGEKMWTTNGGFADLFVVFAKVDGEQFTAFLVERALPGVSSGKEENKMGLHGSSTTPVILQDARVPGGNLLGEIGNGHKVAFGVLNYGRFKLGAMSCGGAKSAIAEAARYAKQRKQFGQPIANFGAIKHKIAEMTIRTYALESMIYRTTGLIDKALEACEVEDNTGMLAVLDEYAIEASILKVAGSETLNYVLDENMQIHGGNGYVRDYPAERHYRDGRVNRIFEGTNEINRLLIPGMLARRALKGSLPLIAAARKLQDEVLSTPAVGTPGEGPLDDEVRAVAAFKKVALMTLGTAMQTFGPKLTEEQEVLSLVADIMIDTYASESVVLRALCAIAGHEPAAAFQADAARVQTNDAAARIETAARQTLAAMAAGDVLRTQLACLRRLLKVMPLNTVTLRRRLADATIEKTVYIFS